MDNKAVILGVVVVAFFSVTLYVLSTTVESNGNGNNLTDNTMNKVEDFDEFEVEVLEKGEGEVVQSGDQILVHYKGELIDGTKFDSSYDRGEPIDFQIGTGRVIAGWDEGIVGQTVGSKLKLNIPSSMGYGASGAGASIPPFAGLVFEVEIIETSR